MIGTTVVATAALVTAACSSGGASGNTTGITATTVLLGSHQPLTGPAAPGYSEIAPAMQAYFNYVNANGGVNGRKITLKYLDDGYNPTNTVQVVHQLVLQDKVFAILGGLGTPTHTKVVDYLNQQKVPDLFVSSGCLCWDEPKQHPETFGWQTDYVVEGKILGQYIAQHYAGKKIAYFYQNDDFGQGGVKGLDKYIPASSVVSRQSYEPTNTNVAPQVSAIAQAKADVVVLFSIPAFTALFKLTALKLNYNPQLVVSNVGADPVTLSGLLAAFAKQGGATVNGMQLIDGMISDAYLPSYLASDASSNSWIELFKKIHDQYLAKLPFDGNVEYGMALAYTFVQALQNAGKNPTRESIVKAVEKGGFTGPGLVPFRYSSTSHAGYTGVQVTQISGGVVKTLTPPETTDDGSGAIQPYNQQPPQAPSSGVP